MADATNIIAATISSDGASIYCAPTGTAAPNAPTVEPDAAWIELGWVSEDGVTNGIQRDTTKHYAWGGSVVKTTQDKYTETFKFALLESSREVLELVFGKDNVTGTGDNILVDHTEKMLDRQSFIIDFVDGDRIGRHYIKDGMVTEVGDLVYTHKGLMQYELTVDVYKPADGTAAVETSFAKAPASGGTAQQGATGGGADAGYQAPTTANVQVKAKGA
jgi:hypothetical protein